MITNEECIESNVIPVEAMKFLADDEPVESVANAGTANEQDGEDEDLVCYEKIYVFLLFHIFTYSLF